MKNPSKGGAAMKPLRTLCAILALTLALCACSGSKKADRQYSDTAMGVSFEVAAFGDELSESDFEALCREALVRVKNVEHVTDLGDSVSEICRFNSEKWGIEDAGEIFSELVSAGMYAHDLTDGGYDPAIGLLTELWSRGGAASQDERVELALSHSGARFVTVSVTEKESKVVKVDEKLHLDLGAIRCGYAAEEALRLFDNSALERGSVTLGNTTGYFGTPGDEPFTYAARDHHGKEFAKLKIPDGFVSCVFNDYNAQSGTSSVIDPSTGKSAKGDVRFAIVRCESGTMSAAFAYAFCVMPSARSIGVWRECPIAVDALIVTSDGTVYAMGSFAEDGAVELSAPEYHITRIKAK